MKLGAGAKVEAIIKCIRLVEAAVIKVTKQIQSFQEKLCFFFKIHCNPSLAYIAVSSQRNARVQSILLAGNFLYNQKQPSAGEGEVVANFREFLEKKHNIHKRNKS